MKEEWESQSTEMAFRAAWDQVLGQVSVKNVEFPRRRSTSRDQCVIVQFVQPPENSIGGKYAEKKRKTARDGKLKQKTRRKAFHPYSRLTFDSCSGVKNKIRSCTAKSEEKQKKSSACPYF